MRNAIAIGVRGVALGVATCTLVLLGGCDSGPGTGPVGLFTLQSIVGDQCEPEYPTCLVEFTQRGWWGWAGEGPGAYFIVGGELELDGHDFTLRILGDRHILNDSGYGVSVIGETLSVTGTYNWSGALLQFHGEGGFEAIGIVDIGGRGRVRSIRLGALPPHPEVRGRLGVLTGVAALHFAADEARIAPRPMSGGVALNVRGRLDYAIMAPPYQRDTTHHRPPIWVSVVRGSTVYLSAIELRIEGGQYSTIISRRVEFHNGGVVTENIRLSGTVYREGPLIVFDGGRLEEGYGILEGDQLRVFDLWPGVFGSRYVAPRLTGVFSLAP
jgi:hypothetical protein